jgi:hypothetical protein
MAKSRAFHASRRERSEAELGKSMDQAIALDPQLSKGAGQGMT